MSDPFGSTINTRIWAEESEANNPFAAANCRCYGYDVYGDLLGNASYIEYLFLLFKGERPSTAQAEILECLAIALANPGPRDASVHAAMAVCVSGAPAANTLIAALSVGAGSYTGAREVFLALERWKECGTNIELWYSQIKAPPNSTRTTIWPDCEQPPGFDPYGKTCSLPVRQILNKLTILSPDKNIFWLANHRLSLEAAVGMPINMLNVAAAAIADLGFSSTEGEMLTLLLRLPGAAVHALEQKERGFRQFPFFELELEYDPTKRNTPQKLEEI